MTGDYNSDIAESINIQLKKCDSELRTDCKSEEEITQWLRRKFIIVVTNNERFEPTTYTDDERVVQESTMIWYPVKSTIRESISNEIEVTNLILNDNKWIQFGDYTKEE